jgi:hypothetical protein
VIRHRGRVETDPEDPLQVFISGPDPSGNADQIGLDLSGQFAFAFWIALELEVALGLEFSKFLQKFRVFVESVAFRCCC